jgi:hypothetical protein
MYHLISGATLIVLGIGLLIFYSWSARQQKERTAFEKPYLKNGGIGFILFGLYFISQYFVK